MNCNHCHKEITQVKDMVIIEHVGAMKTEYFHALCYYEMTGEDVVVDGL
jgi:hypothetical protein